MYHFPIPEASQKQASAEGQLATNLSKAILRIGRALELVLLQKQLFLAVLNSVDLILEAFYPLDKC